MRACWPTWVADLRHFSNLSFLRPREAQHEIRLKVDAAALDDEVVDRQHTSGEVITIVHPEELTIKAVSVLFI